MESGLNPFDLVRVSASFAIPGDFVAAARYGSGHINDSFALAFSQAGAPVRYLLQRINSAVFKDPAAVMDNISRVTVHLRAKLASQPDASRRALTLVPGRDGALKVVDPGGNTWRCYLFIEGASSHDVITHVDHARRAAAAFGAFQGLLIDLPGGRLREVIPDFHHTVRRFEALERAVAADTAGKARFCQPEIDFALGNSALAASLLDRQAAGLLPERITHNDTKISNVMLDDATGEGICVVDLDTVMPGLALYDFGDMVRTATSPTAEDELDLSRVRLRMPFFEALVEGYLSTAGAFLNPTERACLALSGQVITFEIGLRFLTDYLEGDVYYRVSKENHNLHRCRTQFALAADIGAKMAGMNAVVASVDTSIF